MKRKRKLLLSALLLMLCIAPIIFVFAEQTMRKDFTLSTQYDVSEQSITSFAETLPDVLFYPDSFYDDEIVEIADAGTFTGTGGEVNDWTATQVKDGTVWRSTIAPYDMELEFFGPDGVMGFDYALYITTSGGGTNPEYYFYDFIGSAYVKIGDISSDSWHNGTAYNQDYISSSYDVEIKIECEAGETAYWDYAELKFHVMHLASSDHYAESFADVNDWTTSDTSITTDDDVATITENGAGATGRAYASFSSRDFFEYYYEFRIESMTATTTNLEFWDGDSYETLKTFTAAGTYKGIISDSDATTMERIGFLVGSESGNLLVDYLRISPANESGWQHDGSTTIGVTDEGDAGYTYSESSDGDILTLTVTDDGGNDGWALFYIAYDTTSTSIDIERDYYQFIELRYRITVFSGVNRIVMKPHLDGYTVTTESDILWATATCDWTTLRANLLSMTTISGEKYLEFHARTTGIGQTATIQIDYAKYYSIANFTVTQSGTSVDDVLYVDSDILYCSDTSFTSFVLDHDPALSIDTAFSDIWILTTSVGVPQIDFYIGSWVGYSSATQGMLATGTLTDVRVKFTARANIESITFLIHTSQWNLIYADAYLFFIVPFEMWGMETAIIILGLIMIPVSTLYLAYGIKHDRSSDRLFFGLIIFIMGFALLVAGVMP